MSDVKPYTTLAELDAAHAGFYPATTDGALNNVEHIERLAATARHAFSAHPTVGGPWKYTHDAERLADDLLQHIKKFGLEERQRLGLPREHWMLIIGALKRAADVDAARAHPEDRDRG